MTRHHLDATTTVLPVVDVDRFRRGDAAERRAVADEIGRACESIGFLYAANHGVPQRVIDGGPSAYAPLHAGRDLAAFVALFDD